MSTTIASASVLNDGTLAILVEAGEAASLFGYLQAQKVNCIGPTPVIWRPRRVTRDGMGKLNIEEDVLECEIFAKGTLDDFAKWISNWMMSKVGC
jgi:hypothetical protein